MPKIPGKQADDFKPFWQTTDQRTVRLYQGNSLDVLRRLPAQSVHCVVTSPPYWGLRDYGNDKSVEIGSEKSPQEFVDSLVAVFREVRRVLRDDGTVWLNLGDSYSSGSNLVGIPWRVALALQADGWILRQDIIWAKPSPMPESVKNRCTKAHEYVFLLTKKMGYFYDAEAINEPHTSSGVRHATSNESLAEGTQAGSAYCQSTSAVNGFGRDIEYSGRNKRSVWTVASQGYPGAHFATYPPKLIEPMILAGTSAYGCCVDCGAPWKRIVEEKQLTRERPNDYVKRTCEPGTGNSCANSVAGVESKTVGWEPTCECHGKFVKRKGKRLGFGGYNLSKNTAITGQSSSLSQKQGQSRELKEFDATIIEYVSDLPLDDHPVRPCVVLDPFIGSGTTCCVSLANGRHSIGIDLSEKYLKANAIPRIEGELLARPALKYLTGRQATRLEIGKKLS